MVLSEVWIWGLDLQLCFPSPWNVPSQEPCKVQPHPRAPSHQFLPSQPLIYSQQVPAQTWEV